MTQAILVARRAILTNGYAVIPIVGKIPSISEWQKIENVSQELLESWERNMPWAGNSGIPTKHVPTLDLDLVQEPAAIAAENMVRERFEAKGKILTRVGRAPKRAIPFRTNTPFRKITTVFTNGERIEFLADGQQFVAHGIHPDTQQEYVWSGGDPSSVACEELPEIDGAEARKIHDDVVEMLIRDFGYVVDKSPPARTNGAAAPRRAKGTGPNNPKRDLAWANAALEKELASIANASPGTRNATLNLGAFNIFQIVHGDPELLDEAEVRARLLEAAVACGLAGDDGEDSVLKTIDSAFSGAESHPRVRPPALLEQPIAAGSSGGGGGVLGNGPAPAIPSAGAAPAPGTRPIIQLTESERYRIVDEAESALLAAGCFDLYQRDAIMIRPVVQKLPAAPWHGIKRQTATWRLMRVKQAYLLEMLERAARFSIYDGRRKDWVARNCPDDIAEMLMAREGAWRVPTLLGIVHTPQLRADGTLLTTPGYDPQTRLLFKPDGEVFPDIPDRPGQDDARKALEVVKHAVSTFPFKTEADRSVALALFLTGMCRRVLDFAPLFGLTAPMPGTGKSLLVDLCSILLTGQPAPVLSVGTDNVEFEKRLGACLMAGDPIISLDNCVKPLDQALLAQATSQKRLNVRILGFSQNRDVTMSALLVATGNNLVLQGDLPRRSLRCEIDANVERPELREFAGPHITHVFRQQRGVLVTALLTILRAWQVSGETGQKPLGGFEMWSNWVRDALTWLGCEDPCNTIEVIRAGNPEREKHEAMVLAWRDHHKLGTDKVVKVRDLIEAADMSPPPGQSPGQPPPPPHPANRQLHDALLGVDEDHRRHGSISQERLGWWLRKINGKREQGLQIVRVGSSNGYTTWKLTS